MSKVVVTGGAGFIGSNLTDSLVMDGHDVHVIDNFSTGSRELVHADKVTLHEIDISSTSSGLSKVLDGAETLYHLAANADVRDGWSHPRKDFEQNVDATLNLAEAAVACGVSNFVFTSTGSIYGEAVDIPTAETSRIPTQTSLYGASKIAAEGFLQAYAEADKFKVTIFRLVSVLGPRYSHGHVIDFYNSLQKDSTILNVLGNGRQTKSYMHVEDCVRALKTLRGNNSCEVFNIGRNEFVTVRESIAIILETLGLSPDIIYGDQNRGWIGDNPFIHLDVTKAKEHGWEAQTPIRDSIRDTVLWLQGESN